MNSTFSKEIEAPNPNQQWTMRAAAFFLLFLVVVGLVSCSNPEEEKKKRQTMLEQFVTDVAKHLYDRNPNTVQESMTQLFREELTEPVIQKLQKAGQLPHTELGILKIISEDEDNKTTNSVVVDLVKPLGPMDKDIIPLQVTGKSITKYAKKPDQIKPFTITVACRLDKTTGAWPQVVDLSVMAPESTRKSSQSRSRHKRY